MAKNVWLAKFAHAVPAARDRCWALRVSSPSFFLNFLCHRLRCVLSHQFVFRYAQLPNIQWIETFEPISRHQEHCQNSQKVTLLPPEFGKRSKCLPTDERNASIQNSFVVCDGDDNGPDWHFFSLLSIFHFKMMHTTFQRIVSLHGLNELPSMCHVL